MAVTVSRCWWSVQALCRCRSERRVIRVNIRDLNFNEALCVCRRRAQALAQQFRYSLDELRMQPRETLQFLVHECVSS